MFGFGPKAPCAHCCRSVGKPRDPSQYLCPHCGQPGPWATPEQVAHWNDLSAARRSYADTLAAIAASGAAPPAAALAAIAARTDYSAGELRKLALDTLHQCVEAALADHELSQAEDDRLDALKPSLGVGVDDLSAGDAQLPYRLATARANAGRLPVLASSSLITRNGEAVHGEFPAWLMKEVTKRVYQAGYSGVSIPIGHTRARVHLGGARGHSVVVGTELQASDTGTLVVTSLRSVFLGAQKTLEMSYDKLANLAMFSDGVQFHLTNRQAAPLFKVANGELVAAFIHAAAQRVAGG